MFLQPNIFAWLRSLLFFVEVKTHVCAGALGQFHLFFHVTCLNVGFHPPFFENEAFGTSEEIFRPACIEGTKLGTKSKITHIFRSETVVITLLTICSYF